jgi:hypothetical protein
MEPKSKLHISSLAIAQNLREIPQLAPPARKKRETWFIPAKIVTFSRSFSF